MTKRDLVKAAANFAVYSVACDAIESTVDNHTELNVEENLPVRIGCYVVALYATSFTKPHVNNVVDKLADRWIARKELRANQKMEESVAAAA